MTNAWFIKQKSLSFVISSERINVSGQFNASFIIFIRLIFISESTKLFLYIYILYKLINIKP